MTGGPAAGSIWVQKFGGTSVATPALMENAARRIAARRAEGHRVVAVVSAMGDTTDRLLALARALTDDPPRRELDVLLSAGEVQSMALLVMALQAAGVPAISFTGQQVGIRTDSRYSNARIQSIDGARLLTELDRDRVVVVAGFQGVTPDDDITTLGRGGSDTSAVALAAALDASCCEILTDVDGVFTANPRVVPQARLIEAISHDEMLEMAGHGARVLHGRAVDLARRYQVVLRVASATCSLPGTRIVTSEELKGTTMESVVVRGVVEDPDVVKVAVLGVPDRPGVAAQLFTLLGDAGVNIRLVVQAQSHAGANDITFIVPADVPLPAALLERTVAAVGGRSHMVDANVALLSVVGEGIAREPGVAARLFTILAEQGINIDLISSSNLSITCVVPGDACERGARALHQGLVEVG